MPRIAAIFNHLRPGTLSLPGLLLLILFAGCAAPVVSSGGHTPATTREAADPGKPRAMPFDLAMTLVSGEATVRIRIDSAVRQGDQVSLPAVGMRMVIPQVLSARLRLELTSDEFALGSEWEKEFDLRARPLLGLRLLLASGELSRAEDEAHERARGFQLALRL